jgi:cytochrome c-type biogenesis protein CcmH/NrfF
VLLVLAWAWPGPRKRRCCGRSGEQRLVAISEEMRCLVCQNESLSASRSTCAGPSRELRTLIKQGKTDAEIREFMVSRYGDFVPTVPREPRPGCCGPDRSC